MGDLGWFRRRQYLVRTGFQVRFIAWLALQMSVILAAIGLVVWAHMEDLGAVAATTPFSAKGDPVALAGELVDNAHGFYVRSLVLIGVTASILVLFGLLASHRLAGPIAKLERYLHDVADGDLTQRIAFRRQDNLDDFAARLNETVEAIEARRLQVRELGIELLRRCRKLDDDAERGRAVADLESLLGRLRGTLA